MCNFAHVRRRAIAALLSPLQELLTCLWWSFSSSDERGWIADKLKAVQQEYQPVDSVLAALYSADDKHREKLYDDLHEAKAELATRLVGAWRPQTGPELEEVRLKRWTSVLSEWHLVFRRGLLLDLTRTPRTHHVCLRDFLLYHDALQLLRECKPAAKVVPGHTADSIRKAMQHYFKEVRERNRSQVEELVARLQEPSAEAAKEMCSLQRYCHSLEKRMPAPDAVEMLHFCFEALKECDADWLRELIEGKLKVRFETLFGNKRFDDLGAFVSTMRAYAPLGPAARKFLEDCQLELSEGRRRHAERLKELIQGPTLEGPVKADRFQELAGEIRDGVWASLHVEYQLLPLLVATLDRLVRKCRDVLLSNDTFLADRDGRLPFLIRSLEVKWFRLPRLSCNVFF